ncbi:MAG: extracellular solute-binding protein [Treponema sp.]|jgi:putative aldouronate transport system substrate-binding protein|nr:extracellular solute-binding protein [Treponema sp.]
MKRIAIIATAGALALSMLGCTAKGGTSSASPAKSGSSGGGGATVTVKVEVFDRGSDGGKTDPTNNQWTKWIKEKVLKDENINVEFVRVPRGDESNALINLMAAGTPPDVCYTYSGDNITNWANQGGLFDMAPYVDSVLKDLNTFLGPDKAIPGRQMIIRNQNNNTKEIHSIPARRMNVAMRNVFIRKDWLDTLGLPMPTTTEEYHAALLAFKNQDPGNVGAAKLIPFTIGGNRVDWNAGNLMEPFIDPKLSDKERWINNVAERNFLVAGYKEGLRFMNTLFNEGLVDRDFPLYKDAETPTNLIKSGVVGSFSGNWDDIYREPNGMLTDLKKNVPAADIRPVDCITSADGITHKPSYDAAGVNLFIPLSCKNPDAAMRYINWLARYENYHFIQTGPEGTVHEIVDGIPKLIPNAPDGWIQNSAQNIDYTLSMNGLFLGSDESNIKALANGYSWPADRIVEAYSMSMNNARPGIVVVTKNPLVVAGPLTETLTQKGMVIYTQAITCAADRFDSEYDRLVADWLSSGAQKIIDERAANFQ